MMLRWGWYSVVTTPALRCCGPSGNMGMSSDGDDWPHLLLLWFCVCCVLCVCFVWYVCCVCCVCCVCRVLLCCAAHSVVCGV